MSNASRPLQAAFLIFGVNMLQLPTPTPTPEPQIPLSELESLWRAAATETRLLSDGDKLFIVALIVAIAVVIYIWKRPKPVDTDAVAITTLGTTLGRIGTQNENMAAERIKTAEETARRQAEQDDRQNKVLQAIGASIASNAEANAALTETSITTQALVKQLMERDDNTSKSLTTMVEHGSLPLRNLITMAEGMVSVSNDIKSSVLRLELQQNEILGAIQILNRTNMALNQAAVELTKAAGDTGNVATVEVLDAPPDQKAS